MCSHLLIKFITHLGLRCGCPFGASTEVLFQQGPVGAVLKEPSAPRHWGLNDLLAYDHEDVTWHGGIKPGGFKVRGLIDLGGKYVID